MRSPARKAETGMRVSFAAFCHPMRKFCLMRSEITGEQPRLATHCLLQVASAQQEKQQHQGKSK